MGAPDSGPDRGPAALVVTTPSGGETRVPVERLPFRIGRQAGNELVLRDSRISREHARIVREKDDYVLEDLKSSYGVFLNGERIERRKLRSSDRIEFGFPDSYRLTFLSEDSGRTRLESLAAEGAPAGGSNLSKLRATLEVARALSSSLSTDEVLTAVVDAALAVTGCERGFLLMRQGEELETRVARSRTGPLAPSDLRVPTRLLMRALRQRKEFLSMSFDPDAEPGAGERSVFDLELRAVVCVPLVRVRSGSVQETASLSALEDTVGLLYMDSRAGPADLSAGGRELLTTLALEASTVLENARLLEELWARQQFEREMRIARQIQESLLPRALPARGWLRAAGSSTPAFQVGGDYFDLRPVHEGCWAAVLADVSGKGVGAALLAALLEGMFLAAPYTGMAIEEMMLRVNRFLIERTGGEQFVTAFYCTVESSGMSHWVNAGHPPALLLHPYAGTDALPANTLPLGMMEETAFSVEQVQLRPGDKLLLYSDGLSEARNGRNEFFGLKRLREVAAARAACSCQELHDAVLGALKEFAGEAEQADDVTLLVLEYRP